MPWLAYSNAEPGATKTTVSTTQLPSREPQGIHQHTDSFSYTFCSLLRRTIRFSCRFLDCALNSSSCCFSLACCFRSISARLFCVTVDELCESVPSSAPNSRCPRFRSSSCPLLRRPVSLRLSVLVFGAADGLGEEERACSVLTRRRLLSLSSSEMGDCLLFSTAVSWAGGSGSGKATAEAMDLCF